MIIRILTEGQFDVPDSEIEGLNVLDEKLEAAIQSGDEVAFKAALAELLSKVREVGQGGGGRRAGDRPTCCCRTPTPPCTRFVTCSAATA